MRRIKVVKIRSWVLRSCVKHSTTKLPLVGWLKFSELNWIELNNRECCHFVPSNVEQWRHDQGRNVWRKYQIHHEPTLFFSLFIGKRAKQICELKVEAKKKKKKKKRFFCIAIGRKTKWSMQIETFAHFVRFKFDLPLRFGSPLNTFSLHTVGYSQK